MSKTLPNWLVNKYFTLFLSFGLMPFSVNDAKRALGTEKASLLLFKMRSYGWVDKCGRKTYRVVHPIVSLMEASGFRWRDEVRQRDRLPVLELAVARLFEVLGSRLESIILFGSLARGEAKPESDIDLLIVAEGLPAKYGERVKVIREAIYSNQVDELVMYMWRERRIYPEFNVILITKEEAGVTHPFYLDMVRDCVVIFDKNGLMSRKIREVGERLRELGAVRVEEPGGSWYWILTPRPEAAREVEL